MAPKKVTKNKSTGKTTKGRTASKATPDTSLEPLERDALLKLIHATMPLPMREEDCADGSHVYVGGDPDEVVVRVSNHRIIVSLFAIVWEGKLTPVVRPQSLASLNWKLIPAARLTPLLQGMIETARKLRRARFRKCDQCGETKPPEWMHAKGGCQSCAEQHLADAR